MGNLCICHRQVDPDSEWRRQNQETGSNPMYKYVGFDKGGRLLDAYMYGGRKAVLHLARIEIEPFLYNNGAGKIVNKAEYIQFKRRCIARQNSQLLDYSISDHAIINAGYNVFHERWVCWDLDKRGGVGETAFLLLYLHNTPIHTKIAKILLKEYPKLALDVYEGNEYYGESALHIAVVYGNFKAVRTLVNKGADIHQQATGSFFLPKFAKGNTKTTNQGLTYYGEYPLAFAAVFSHYDIYDYLIRKGANPNAQDSFGNTVLHMIVITDQQEMFKFAVKHHTFPANMHVTNKDGLTPLALASKLGRAKIFQEMLELGSVETWRFSNVMCSVYPLSALDTIGPDGQTEWNSALMFIVNGETDDHLNMIEGDVINQLLDEKWKTFASGRFFNCLMLALFHLIMLSIAIYLRPSTNLLHYNHFRDAIRYMAEIIVCIGCIVSVAMQVFEVQTQGVMVFIKNCRHAPARTVFLISCFLIIICIPVRLLSLATSHDLFHTIEDGLLIIATPCSWFFLLFFARSTKALGPFIIMLFKMISGDIVKFVVIYVIFMTSFSQAFFFLFRDIPDIGITSFLTLPGTIMTLFMMTFGEFKYDEFGETRYAIVTKIVFAIFMILVPILLLNMLIAMMGNTYQQVICKSEKEWKKQWAQIVVVLERSFTKSRLKQFRLDYSTEFIRGTNTKGDYTETSNKHNLRALMVVKPTHKTKAQQRKDALAAWKRTCKEVIHRLKDGAICDGQMDSNMASAMSHMPKSQAMLDVVQQEAWVKDVSLQMDMGAEISPTAVNPKKKVMKNYLLGNYTGKNQVNGNKNKVHPEVEESDFMVKQGDCESWCSRESSGSMETTGHKNVDAIIGLSSEYFNSSSGQETCRKVYRRSQDNQNESPFRRFRKSRENMEMTQVKLMPDQMDQNSPDPQAKSEEGQDSVSRTTQSQTFRGSKRADDSHITMKESTMSVTHEGRINLLEANQSKYQVGYANASYQDDDDKADKDGSSTVV